MQVNSINNNQQSFGMRNILLDKSLINADEKIMKGISEALPNLYKLGDDKTDLFIAADKVQVKTNVVDKNAPMSILDRLIVKCTDGFGVVNLPFLPDTTKPKMIGKTIDSAVQMAVLKLQEFANSSTVKQFKELSKMTEKQNDLGGNYSQNNIGFLGKITKNPDSSYSTSKIGFQA